MRLSRLSLLLAGAIATALVAMTAPGAGAASPVGPEVPSNALTGWTGQDRSVAQPRATLPEDVYAMAGGCYVLRQTGGNYVRRNGDGFAATAASAAQAEPFNFRATALEHYLLYGSAEDFLAVSEGALGTAAYGATESDQGQQAGGLVLEQTDAAADAVASSEANRASGRGGSVVSAEAPSDLADWKVGGSTNQFKMQLPATGQWLAVDGSGALIAAETPTLFAIEKRDGCAQFPEIEVNVDGPVLGGQTTYQEVRGFLEAHLHMMAFDFIGGRSRCGRPWHRFGPAYALVDCPDHKPGGHGAVLEQVLSGGTPGEAHNTDGWPTFEGWPKPASLTHEQVYYKWLERAWRGGLRMFVNLLVDNQKLCEIYPYKKHGCNEMDGVRRQARYIRELENYIDAQSGGPGEGWFRIVEDPFEARKVMNQGKLAVVLGIEVSTPLDCGVLRDVPTCDQEVIDDRLQEVYDLGVRQMELVNKFDNAFTGVKGDGGSVGLVVNGGNFLQTGSWWRMDNCDNHTGHTHDHDEAHDHQQMNFHDDAGTPDQFTGRDGIFGAVLSLSGQVGAAPIYPQGEHCNTMGLTPHGETMIREMVERGMIFDPDHMSSNARTEAMDLVAQIGNELKAQGSTVSPGVVSSHSWADDTIYERIYELGGVVTPHAGSSTSFKEKWEKHRQWADDRFLFGIGFGSDANGFSKQGGPRGSEAAPPSNPVEYPFDGFGGARVRRQQSGTKTYDVNFDGVAHYGLYPDWIEDLRRLAGEAIVNDFVLGPEAYLQMWERALGVPGSSCRSDVEDLTPRDFNQLAEGMSTKDVLMLLGQPKARLGDTFEYCLMGEHTATVTFSGNGQVLRWNAGPPTVTFIDSNPTSGQVTDEVTVSATVTDVAGEALGGETVTFAIGSVSSTATTSSEGVAQTRLRLQGPPAAAGLTATLASADGEPVSVTAPFTILKEDTALRLFDLVATRTSAPAKAVLTQDGQGLAGRRVSFFVEQRVNGKRVTEFLGTAVTSSSGVAKFEIPSNKLSRTVREIKAVFEGDRDFTGSSDLATAYRR